MFKIKACLYSKGNLSEYVRSLGREDRRPIQMFTTCTCGSSDLETVFNDEVKVVTIAGVDRHIKLAGVPKCHCRSCDKVIGNLRLSKTLSDILDDVILASLNHHEPVPEELDFAELAGI